MPYARYVLPALLVLLASGSFLIVATSGTDQAPVRPLEAPAQTAPKRKHEAVRVKSGDTAAAIAERAGITIDRLKTLNPGVALDALRPGQRLRLAR